MKRKQIVIGLITITLMGSCRSERKSQDDYASHDKLVKVETAIAQKEKDSDVFNYSGLITPLITTHLSFQIPGTIDNIFVEEGDFVRKGQVLAELDKSTLESSYKAAKATQLQALDAYDRLKTVYEKGSLPEIQWEEVKSKLEQGNAAEQIAKNNLDNCCLKAPKNGVIGTRNIEVGSSAIPGINAFDLVTINDVYVRISVPENEINKLKKGMEASIVIPATGQAIYKGKVERIGVVANQISKTYEVNIRVSNPELVIKPGMVCDVNIAVRKGQSKIEIPSQAVFKETGNKNYVFLIDNKSGIAKKQEVEVGEYANNNLQILAGIQTGDVVVVSGQHKLTDDMEVAY